KLAVRQNDNRQAEKHFRLAIKLIETLRSPLAAEEFRMAFLANKLIPYESLAKIYLTENKLRKAFTVVEKARSRVLAESLGGSVRPTNDNRNKNSGALSKKMESLREELNYFYSRLNRADEEETKRLQTEAKRREKQIASVMRQIESTRSGSSNFSEQSSDSETARFKQLQNQLGARKALIEFVNFDGVLSAFVVTDKKIQFVKDLAKEAEIFLLLESLQFQFDALRYGAKSLGKHIGELKKRADFYLRKLYEKLLAPIEKYTAKKNLIVVPVGALHYVPFHALFDGDRYAIETREVVYAPSATVWQFLASKPSQKSENALLVGFADERIPFVNSEIEILEKIFRKSKSYTGEQATFAAFTENAPNFNILHLACHGNFRPENPLFSSLHLADGWITVRDVCSQNLKAEIVTLSACETGLNKIFAGDEILGLARGFLTAGARSLLLSLWTVNDEAATVLMKTFYSELQAGKTASESLKTAQIDFIERGIHPYFWSPFALIGR
ncbi:MAG TPA: CHAT domain-containing protein, partial [Pyrinomonadaceae bacterium]|nr:CHAT domain-containing protein [Pyrinomonadaceae bacterium]